MRMMNRIRTAGHRNPPGHAPMKYLGWRLVCLLDYDSDFHLILLFLVVVRCGFYYLYPLNPLRYALCQSMCRTLESSFPAVRHRVGRRRLGTRFRFQIDKYLPSGCLHNCHSLRLPFSLTLPLSYLPPFNRDRYVFVRLLVVLLFSVDFIDPLSESAPAKVVFFYGDALKFFIHPG